MVIERHARWDHRLVIEGYALRPAYVHGLGGDVDGVFVVADEALIEKRVRASDFSQGARDAQATIAGYCGRSLWDHAMLRKEVTRLGLKAVEVCEGMSPDEIADACLEAVAREEPGPADADARMTRAQCIVCREGKLLMVQLADGDARWWCLPGGGVEPGESAAQAALRELEEECSVHGALVRQMSRWMDAEGHETVTFLVEIGEQRPRVNAAAQAQGLDPGLAEVRWMALDELPERDRTFLWAAGLLGVEGFWGEVSRWGDEASYPRG